ncbi:MAG: hypothetical protein WAU28_03525 [Candidatus Moraniibacteriota bacterium]
MFFHLTLFLWSLGYLLSLELLALNPNLTDWKSYGFSLFFVSAIALLAVYRATKKMTGVPIPLLFSLSTPTLLFLIDSRINQHIFVGISTIAFYSLLLGLYRLRFAPSDETALAFMHAGGMASLLLFYAAGYGLYLNFDIPLWMLMTTVGLSTFWVAYQMFRVMVKKKRRTQFLCAAFLSLVMTEASLIASMWPFGYLTTAALLLIVFFFVWEGLLLPPNSRFFDRKFLWQTLLLFGFSALLLYSSPWRVLV